MYCVTKKLLGVCFVGVVMGAYLLPHLYIIYIYITSSALLSRGKKHTKPYYIMYICSSGGLCCAIHRKRSRTKGTKKDVEYTSLYIYILYDNIHIILKKKKNFVGSLA
jgi:hypothetical protein